MELSDVYVMQLTVNYKLNILSLYFNLVRFSYTVKFSLNQVQFNVIRTINSAMLHVFSRYNTKVDMTARCM